MEFLRSLLRVYGKSLFASRVSAVFSDYFISETLPLGTRCPYRVCNEQVWHFKINFHSMKKSREKTPSTFSHCGMIENAGRFNFKNLFFYLEVFLYYHFASNKQFETVTFAKQLQIVFIILHISFLGEFPGSTEQQMLSFTFLITGKSYFQTFNSFLGAGEGGGGVLTFVSRYSLKDHNKRRKQKLYI